MTQFVEIRHFCVMHQISFTRHDVIIRLATLDDLIRHFGGRLHQTVHVITRLFQAVDNVAPDCAELLSGEFGVQIIRHPVQLLGGKGPIGMNDTVLDFLVVDDQNDQDTVGGKG